MEREGGKEGQAGGWMDGEMEGGRDRERERYGQRDGGRDGGRERDSACEPGEKDEVTCLPIRIRDQYYKTVQACI